MENTKNLLFLLMFSFFSCDFSIKRALLEREKKKKNSCEKFHKRVKGCGNFLASISMN